MTNIWTNSEIEFLTINYPIYGNKYCSSNLGRSYSSIKTKANRLNLKAPDNASGRNKKSHEEYEKELMKLEVDVYPIDKYIDYHTPIKHSCIEGHEWLLSPASAIRGRQCPTCIKSCFNPSNPGLLYYIKIIKDSVIYYKVGITNKTIEERFSKDKDVVIIVLLSMEFPVGQQARDIEKELLTKFKKDRIKVPGFIDSGWTELFQKDILNLDK